MNYVSSVRMSNIVRLDKTNTRFDDDFNVSKNFTGENAKLNFLYGQDIPKKNLKHQ